MSKAHHYFTITITATILFLNGCHTVTKNKIESQGENLLHTKCVSKIVALKHKELIQTKGNFESLKKYVSSLNENNVSVVALALDYIQTCIPKQISYQDSVFTYFNCLFDNAASKLSDTLDTRYKKVIEAADKDSNSTILKIFKNNLATCGMELYETEGNYYIDAQPDYFFKHFKDRVSDDLREFLAIRMDAMKTPLSEDAQLLISFEDVYRRTLRWEYFIKNHPNFFGIDVAHDQYDDYLEILMTGTDNTPTFNIDSSYLEPEVKTLYEKIIKEAPNTKTGKIITGYYGLLSKYGFKYTDDINSFLKSNNLHTMSGVQPPLR